MKREPPFSSSLALVFHRYLELKRALGCTFSVERRVLHSLDRFLADPSNNSSDLTSRTFQQWCRTHETVEMFWTLDLKSCCWDQPRIDPKNGALDVRQKKYTLTRASVPDSDGIRAPAKKKKEAPFSWPHLPLSWHPGYRKSHVAQIVSRYS